MGHEERYCVRPIGKSPYKGAGLQEAGLREADQWGGAMRGGATRDVAGFSSFSFSLSGANLERLGLPR